MEERFKDMTSYDRAVRISLYSNRVGKMEEQKDHTEAHRRVVRAISVRRYLWIMKSRNRR